MLQKILFTLLFFFFTANLIKAQWVQTNGPNGGSVSCLAINSGGHIFAGTSMGLFRSTNNGNTWIQIENLLTSNTVISIIINSSGHIFAGTNGSGIFRSTDDGNNWFQTGLTNGSVTTLAINSSGDIFAATGTYGGMLRSTDNGNNWTPLSLGSVTYFVINSSGYIFAMTYNYIYGNSALYRSTDNGDNWTQIGNGITANSLSYIAINNSNGYIFIAGYNSIYFQNKIFRSTDNGENWIETGGIGTNVYSLLVNNSGHIFAGTGVGVYRSTNNGNNWFQTGMTSGKAVCFSLNSNGHIFAGIEYRGVFKSTDNGGNWTKTNLRNSSAYSLAVNNNGEIFTGTWGNGVYRSNDNGNNWIEINNGGLANGYISSFAINSIGQIYTTTVPQMSGNPNGVFRSTNNGNNWAFVGLPNVQSLAINNNNHIFAGGNGIFRSTDNGDNWTQISNIGIQCLAINNSGDIFSGGNGIFRSTDNGDSWTQISNIGIQHLAINTSGDIFAGSNGGVYRSTDNGNTWFQTGLINLNVTALVNYGSYIFAGTFGGGIYKSTDNGNNWLQISEDLTNFNIRSLSINNITENIFAGTDGSGVWRRPLSEMIPNNVSLISPGNSSQNGYAINTLTPAFLWGSVPSATNYELQLYKKNGASYDLIYNNNIPNTSFYLPTGILTNGSQYYWKVRANVASNWSLYSTPFYFNINISSVTPTIYTSSAIIQTGEQITFSGNYFTANNQAKAVISSNTGYDTSITVTTNNLGALIHSLPFTIPGNYTIYCKDIFTGNSSNQRSFEVRSTTTNFFNITGPPNGYQTNTGENILISWRDKLETGTSYPQINNQRGYKYIVEKSSNSGGSWVLADSLSGFDDINKTRTFNKAILIPAAGSYLIRVKDLYVSNRTTGNVSIQVTSATVSDLVIGFEWDHSYTTNTGKPLGVVSDGTSRIYITVSDPGNTITQATFTLSDDNVNNETRILGKVMGATNTSSYSTEANGANQLSDQGVQHSNNTFWCWYVAPDDFIGIGTSSFDIFRKVKVKVTTNYAGGSPKEKTKEILVRRPPVFLVHGLNSSRSVWDSYMNSPFFNEFVKYLFTIGNQASYESNALQLLSDSGAVEYSIPATINFFRRDSKFACNQIYYIGHSMGGIVLRYAQTNYYSNFYQQKNYGRGYINKFITLATPHLGSPFANLLNSYKSKAKYLPSFITQKFYKKNGENFDLVPAVHDLQMNLHSINSTSYKSHVIIGDIINGFEDFENVSQSTINSLTIDIGLRTGLLIITTSLTEYGILKSLNPFYTNFPGSNSVVNSDLIVPINSQAADMTIEGNNKVSYTVNFHSKATGFPSIEQNSAFNASMLLDKSAFSSDWGELPYLSQNNSYNTFDFVSKFIEDSTSIEIFNPISNDTIYVDSLFNLVFSLSDTVNLKRIEIHYQDKLIIDTIPQFNYNYSLNVSSNMIDTQDVSVLAYYLLNDSTIISYNSVPVIVKSTEVPVQLKSEDNFVYLVAGEDYYLDMNLYFQNSISKIGTKGTRIDIALDNPSIFNYDNVNKKLSALVDGDTYAIVDYDGLKDTIYFKVRGGEEIIPVELTFFNAIQDKDSVLLKWVTQTEVNNLGFEIERKDLSDGQFSKIGFVDGNGTTTIPNNYKYSDKPAQSGKFFYRFKQIDFDGSYTYSPTVEVEFNSIPKQFALFQNYPNPFNPFTTIKYSVPKKILVKLHVYDILGQVVSVLINEVKTPGNYEVNFNASRLSSGVYFYSIQAGDFLSTKKMLLVK